MKLAAKWNASRWMIAALAMLAALIHLFLPGALMKLNALGCASLLAAYLFVFPFLSVKRAWIRLAFIAYVLVTIAAFVGMWWGHWWDSPLGIFTKLVEIGLVVLLWRER